MSDAPRPSAANQAPGRRQIPHAGRTVRCSCWNAPWWIHLGADHFSPFTTGHAAAAGWVSAWRGAAGWQGPGGLCGRAPVCVDIMSTVPLGNKFLRFGFGPRLRGSGRDLARTHRGETSRAPGPHHIRTMFPFFGWTASPRLAHSDHSGPSLRPCRHDGSPPHPAQHGAAGRPTHFRAARTRRSLHNKTSVHGMGRAVRCTKRAGMFGKSVSPPNSGVLRNESEVAMRSPPCSGFVRRGSEKASMCAAGTGGGEGGGETEAGPVSREQAPRLQALAGAQQARTRGGGSAFAHPSTSRPPRSGGPAHAARKAGVSGARGKS